MKKLFIFISVLLFVNSCKKPVIEPQISKSEIAKKIEGYYSVVKQTTEIPVDLDFDGVANTDLFKEFTCRYGVTWEPPPEYNVRMFFDGGDEKSGYRFSVQMLVLYSRVDIYGKPLDMGCYYSFQMIYRCYMVETSPVEFQFTDDATGSASYHWEGLFGIPKKLKWEDNRLYYECKKDFFTSNGWQTVKCFFEFEKNE